MVYVRRDYPYVSSPDVRRRCDYRRSQPINLRDQISRFDPDLLRSAEHADAAKG